MKALLTLVAALALVASVAVDAQQQGGGRGPRGQGQGGPGGQRPQGPQGPGFGRGASLADYVNGLKLTEDQKAAVKEIFEKEKEDTAAWEKDNNVAALQEKMQKAREGNDRTAMQAGFDEMQKLMNSDSRKRIQEDTVTRLGNVLSAEQLEQVKQFVALQAMGPQAVMLMTQLEKCDLTADQKAKILTMIKDTNEKAQAARTNAANNPGNNANNGNANGGRGGNRGGGAFQLWQTLQDDIQNNVLSTEQKAKFAEAQRANRPQGNANNPNAGGRGNRGGGNPGTGATGGN